PKYLSARVRFTTATGGAVPSSWSRISRPASPRAAMASRYPGETARYVAEGQSRRRVGAPMAGAKGTEAIQPLSGELETPPATTTPGEALSAVPNARENRARS